MLVAFLSIVGNDTQSITGLLSLSRGTFILLIALAFVSKSINLKEQAAKTSEMG